MQTVIGVNNSIAVKRFSAALFDDIARGAYWDGRFVGQGRTAMTPVQMLTELESDAGDTVSFDLFAQLRQKPTTGDNRIDGKGEALRPFTDSLKIDQIRSQVSGGGRMSRKRTLHDLRMVAKGLMGDWWSRLNDEYYFSYGAGSRGINADYIEDVGWAGFAGNALNAPDANHLLYGGTSTAKANVTVTDKMDLRLIDRAVAKSNTMGGGTTGLQRMKPIRIDGEDRFVLVMHEFQYYDLKSTTSTGQWLDIQKAAAASQGQKNPIYVGTLGMYNGVVLHKHDAVVRFNDYGVGVNLPASRALFLGHQALVCAYGSPGQGMRLDWNEEMKDAGNEVVITSGCIKGVKKTQFNGNDYGLLSLDTYAIDPNP